MPTLLIHIGTRCIVCTVHILKSQSQYCCKAIIVLFFKRCAYCIRLYSYYYFENVSTFPCYVILLLDYSENVDTFSLSDKGMVSAVYTYIGKKDIFSG